MAGYSGAPLAKKIGIREGSRLFLFGAPENYFDLVVPLPERVQVVSRIDDRTDIVHIFSAKRTELTDALRASLKNLKQDGVIWVSWPKRSSKVPTDITEDTIREVALPMGLVDIKVCAVDNVWSGLKLVIRRENRTAKGETRQPLPAGVPTPHPPDRHGRGRVPKTATPRKTRTATVD